MLQVAKPGDEAALDRFLAQHCETSMFLRGNLATCGLGPSDHPNATQYHMWKRDGAIAAVFGRTRKGYAMCQMPDLCKEAAVAWAQALHGVSLAGITGHADQVPIAVQALGLEAGPWKVAADDPLYSLDLDALDVASDPAQVVRPADAADRAVLETWFTQYELDAGLSPEISDGVKHRAIQSTQDAINGDRVRILEQDGMPVAMTAFNACLPDIVQVGGVFVDRAHRGQGFAGQIVAVHLQEAQMAGVTRAVLFAANPTAARAYEGIGFRRIGSYRINLLDTPRMIDTL